MRPTAAGLAHPFMMPRIHRWGGRTTGPSPPIHRTLRPTARLIAQPDSLHGRRSTAVTWLVRSSRMIGTRVARGSPLTAV